MLQDYRVGTPSVLHAVGQLGLTNEKKTLNVRPTWLVFKSLNRFYGQNKKKTGSQPGNVNRATALDVGQ